MKKKLYCLAITGSAFGIGFFLGGKMLVGMVNDYKKRMNRHQSNLFVLSDWLDYIYAGGNIADYFHKCGFRKIMIYGNGIIGAKLARVLAKTDIEVAAVMDKAASSDSNGTVTGIDSKIPDIDCIVITPVFYYNEIAQMLRAKTDVPIVSIQDIVR